MKSEKLKLAVENFVNELCKTCNIDPKDSNIVDTPDRLYRMYKDELLIGYMNDPTDYLKTFEGVNTSKKPMVIKNIPIKSLCAHHLLPFMGIANITILYKENAPVLGLSKFYRIVNHFSRKLQLQERLTEEIASFLYDNLEIQFISVEIIATHTCVSLRGVNAENNQTSTIYQRGELL